jgi:hypothetical protein
MLSNVDRCVLLNMFTATEAFLGVLYAGFAGAVILGKIMRYNKVAAIVFSECICVRFGSGIPIEQKDSVSKKRIAAVGTTTVAKNIHNSDNDNNRREKRDAYNHDAGSDDDDGGHYGGNLALPFPVLEFRIANVAFARDGGEIANAQVQVWTSTLAEFANKSLKDAADMNSSNGNLRRRRQQILKRQLLDQQMLETQRQHRQVSTITKLAGKAGKRVTGTVGKASKTVTGTVGMAGRAVSGTVGMASKAVTGTVGKASKTVTSRVAMMTSPRKSKAVLASSGIVGMTNNKEVTLCDESRTSSWYSDVDAGLSDVVLSSGGLQQCSNHNDSTISSSSLVPSTSYASTDVLCGDSGVGRTISEKLDDSDNTLQLTQLQTTAGDDDDFNNSSTAVELHDDVAVRFTEAVAKAVGASTRTVTMLEDPPDKGVSQATIYSKLELENDSHPFFKHMWTLRHRIDASSPLLDARGHEILQAHLREKEQVAVAAVGGGGVRTSDGSWPPSLNFWEALRKHIQFKEIMVTLTGTDHVTGNTVYSHTTYTPADIAIGWRFANMLRRDPNGSLGVDLGLINDVIEQVGGGGEPLEGSQLDLWGDGCGDGNGDGDGNGENHNGVDRVHHNPESIVVVGSGSVDIENQKSMYIAMAKA